MRLPAPAAPGHLRGLTLDLGEEVGAPLAALGHAPHAAHAAAALLETTLRGGHVPRTTKELVALAALSAAGVTPWCDALRRSLDRRALDPALLEELEADGETTRLPRRTRRVIAFGRRAALAPALLRDRDFARLRHVGVGDGELAELLALGGALAMLVALSRALGVTRAASQ